MLVALAVVIIASALQLSPVVFLLLFPYTFWLFYKKESPKLLIIIAICTLILLIQTKPKPLPATTELTLQQMKITGATLRGFAKADGQKIYVTYRFTSAEEKALYQATSLYGSKMHAQAEWVPPSRPAHRYAFSMASYLKSAGAVGMVEVSEWQAVGKATNLATMLATQRFNVARHIEDTFPKSLQAEAQALLIGLRDDVDEELTRAYQILGITHLFAISGLHVGLMTAVIYYGLLRLSVRREKATWVLIMALPLYAMLAGGAPSVWRAVTVTVLVLVLQLKQRRIAVDDALALTLIGFVLWQPSSILQVGFQLSYGATISLIYAQRIMSLSQHGLVKAFIITSVTQLAVYPIILYHFFEVSVSSLIMNLFFVPLFSVVILPVTMGLFVLSYCVPPLAQVGFILYEPLRTLLTALITALTQLPWQLWTPGRPAIWGLAIAYLGVLAVFLLLEIERFKQALVVGVLSVLHLHFAYLAERDVTVTFLDVGQGDSIVIELPQRRGVYVIDTGGVLRFDRKEEWQVGKPYEVGRRVVVPYLKGKGITTIDTLILTHPDADHVEGAEEVMQELTVKTIHMTPNSLAKAEVMRAIYEEAVKQGIPLEEQVRGMGWQQAGVNFMYVAPQQAGEGTNNDSLVLVLQYGKTRALFTGDMEAEGEDGLRDEVLRDIDLLKAGHHGSKTSSTEGFIAHTNPRLTIFSAGVNNRYGHPHPDVVARFAPGTTLTTADVGTIEVKLTRTNMAIK